MKDRVLTLSVCTSRTDKIYAHKKMSWSELAQRLSQPNRTPETIDQYKRKPKADQDAIKDVGGFVAGDLKDGHRSSQTVLSRSAICLDLDSAPSYAWDHFTLHFEWAALVYSTHKHTPETPRLRFIIPLSRDVSPEEYEAIARKIADDYLSMEWADDTTFQPSRMMFWPSTSIDGEYFYQCQEGEILAPEEILKLYGGRWSDISHWPFSSRVERTLVTKLKPALDPRSKNGLIGEFCRTYSIQEAIESFIPDAYEPTTKDDRWTYSQGSTAGGLVIYGDGSLAYSFHSTDPIGNGHSFNAFDLVRVHRFGELDQDSTGRGNTLPSYQAMLRLVQEDSRVKQTRIDEAFSQRLEKIKAEESLKTDVSIDLKSYKEKNKDWQGKLTCTKQGKIDESIENVLTILESDTRLKNLGGFNEFSGFAEKSGSLPWWDWNPFKKEWRDADDSELFLYLEKYYGIKKERVMNHGRSIIHHRRAFHPVRDYLDSLPQWDGVERLDTLLVDYMGAEDSEYTRAVTRKTIVGAVTRIYEPGAKMDYTLTLTGKQGIKKSTFFRTLCPDPDWFSDSLDSFQGKEAYEALQGVWFIEVAELSAAKRADVERTKQFLTKQDDKFREAYARNKGRYRRQCVFVATTNSHDFLRDATGNRRWWVVPVVGTSRDVAKELAKERDQIFAEAKYHYRQGETLFLSNDLEKDAIAMQKEYTYTSVRHGVVEDYVDCLVPENWKQMPVSDRKSWLVKKDSEGVYQRDQISLLEIWLEALDGTKERFSTTDQRELAEILINLGWTRAKNPRHVGSEYGRQRVFLRPKDE